MAPSVPRDGEAPPRRGVGPLIPPLSEGQRPLRQQVFERVRAAGLIPRVTLARELAVSPASVTTTVQSRAKVTAAGDVPAGSAMPAGSTGSGGSDRRSHRIAAIDVTPSTIAPASTVTSTRNQRSSGTFAASPSRVSS